MLVILGIYNEQRDLKVVKQQAGYRVKYVGMGLGRGKREEGRVAGEEGEAGGRSWQGLCN